MLRIKKEMQISKKMLIIKRQTSVHENREKKLVKG